MAMVIVGISFWGGCWGSTVLRPTTKAYLVSDILASLSLSLSFWREASHIYPAVSDECLSLQTPGQIPSVYRSFCSHGWGLEFGLEQYLLLRVCTLKAPLASF